MVVTVGFGALASWGRATHGGQPGPGFDPTAQSLSGLYISQLIMGVLGYFLRKLGLDPAPLVLGLVISPTFELSLRQSLIMSNGYWTIFFTRPIALALFVIAAVLLSLSLLALIRRRADWRTKLAQAEAGEAAQ